MILLQVSFCKLPPVSVTFLRPRQSPLSPELFPAGRLPARLQSLQVEEQQQPERLHSPSCPAKISFNNNLNERISWKLWFWGSSTTGAHGMGLFPPLHLRLCSWRRYMGGNHMGFLTYSWNDILVKSGVSWHDKVRVCKGYQIAFRHNASNTKKETCLGKQLANSLIQLHSSLHLLHILLTESCFVWNVTIPCRTVSREDFLYESCGNRMKSVRAPLDFFGAFVPSCARVTMQKQWWNIPIFARWKNQAGLQELISCNITIV